MNGVLLTPILCCALTWAFSYGPYFPIQTKTSPGVDAQLGLWYEKVEAQMNVPELPELANDVSAEAYSMMILPTWGNAILVRVQRHGRIYSLSSRRLDGQAGFEIGKLVESKDFELSAGDSKALEQLIRNLNFFQLPTDDGVNGADGDEWLFQGVSQGQFHFVKRWCASSYNPDKRGLRAFLSLCRFLVDKSALSERPKNKGHKLI
jgi:hypothetical protein